MGILEKLGTLLQGRKTYLTAVLIGVGGALLYLGIGIPDFVWPILSALGLGAVRSAIGKVEKPK